MISLNLQLLPGSDNPSVLNTNAITEKSYAHLQNLIGGLKCRKHPSFRNVINVVAVEGQDPRLEVVKCCCPEFYKLLGYR